MKKIEAIIRLNRFDAVRDALAEIGVRFFTLEQVKGYGLQQGEKMVFEYGFLPDFVERFGLEHPDVHPDLGMGQRKAPFQDGPGSGLLAARAAGGRAW